MERGRKVSADIKINDIKSAHEFNLTPPVPKDLTDSPNTAEKKFCNISDTEEAFRLISQEHSDMILRLCLVTLKCRFDAEDALQDVLLRLYTKLKNKAETFESDEHIKAWLLRVAINRCKTIQEEKRRRKGALFDEKFMGSQSVAKSSGESNTGWLNEYLFALPEKQRKLLYLFYYEGYSTDEIAELLGMSSGSVRTGMTRAREKLKTMIQKKQKEAEKNKAK